MRRLALFLLASVSLFTAAAHAQAVCPNAQPSVTIPLSGIASVMVYDQGCNLLRGPFSVTNGTNPSFPAVTGATAPAVSTVAGTLQFSANSAPAGLKGTFDICFNPAEQCVLMTYTVGAPVTAVSTGTTTP